MDGTAGNRDSYGAYLHRNHFYSGFAGPVDFKVRDDTFSSVTQKLIP